MNTELIADFKMLDNPPAGHEVDYVFSAPGKPNCMVLDTLPQRYRAAAFAEADKLRATRCDVFLVPIIFKSE